MMGIAITIFFIIIMLIAIQKARAKLSKSSSNYSKTREYSEYDEEEF